MSPVVWTRTALEDVDRLVEGLAELSPDAAVRAAQAIRQGGNSLGSNAKRGAMVQGAPGVRKLLVRFGRSGFVIHYAILEDEIVILRVYHGRQDRPV
jgi:plasmid stabilization system protein ParE